MSRGRKKTPSFVLELPLRVDAATDRILITRFEAARHLYNACLGEALRRLERMRTSADWKSARRIPKKQAAQRRAAFQSLRKRFGFHRYALEAYGTACKNACWIGDHLDAPVAQKVARRAMDRSRRATNPGNYNPDGTVKKGPKRWVYSQGYFRLQARLRELQRRLAEARKTDHGQLGNRVLVMGKTIKTEKLSYRAFQKRYGRRIRDRAPSKFIERLNRKAESAGGKLLEFPTHTTRLSQVCHCGSIRKKPLSQRVHICGCGEMMQRDLYSAFLARFVEGERLHVGPARQHWPGAEPLLRAAWRRATGDGAGGSACSTFGAFRRQSGSSEEGGTTKAEAFTPMGEREAAVVPARTPKA